MREMNPQTPPSPRTRSAVNDILSQMSRLPSLRAEVEYLIADLKQQQHNDVRSDKKKPNKAERKRIDGARLAAHLELSKLSGSAADDCALVLRAERTLKHIDLESVDLAIRCSRYHRNISTFAETTFAGRSLAEPTDGQASAEWITSIAPDAKLYDNLQTLLGWQSRRSMAKGPPTTAAVTSASRVVDQLSVAATNALRDVGPHGALRDDSNERKRRAALTELSRRDSAFCATIEEVFQELHPAYDPVFKESWSVLDEFVSLGRDCAAASEALGEETLDFAFSDIYLASIERAINAPLDDIQPKHVFQACRRVLGLAGITTSVIDDRHHRSNRGSLLSVLAMTVTPEMQEISFEDWLGTVQMRYALRKEVATAASSGNLALMRTSKLNGSADSEAK